jgi:hypothetical protein
MLGKRKGLGKGWWHDYGRAVITSSIGISTQHLAVYRYHDNEHTITVHALSMGDEYLSTISLAAIAVTPLHLLQSQSFPTDKQLNNTTDDVYPKAERV